MSKVKSFRKELHKIPEFGLEEFATQNYIYAVLEPLNCEKIKIGTSTAAYFDMGAEKTIALRADIDALKITEVSDKLYSSTNNGMMHACGHDAHSAMLLATAEYLDKNTVPVNVLLIFQAAEELILGANQILASGILEKYRVSSIFGMHVWPGLPEGELYTKDKEFMAMATEINIHIKGKAVHIANHENGVDALNIGALMLLEIYRYADTIKKTHLLKFGKMEAGTIRNIIAKDALIEGSFRCYDNNLTKLFKKEIENISLVYDHEYGSETEISYSDSSQPVINNLSSVKNFGYNILKNPVLQAEDFGNYTQVYPSVFFFLGLGDVPALHTDNFDFNDNVLEKGLTYYIELLNSFK